MKNLNLETKVKNMKGITLVALVISIIVLLILATVSINLVINNGILDKAKYAVDKYSDGEVGEQIKLAYLELQTEKLYNSNVDDAEFLTNRLKQTFGNENVKNVSISNVKVIAEIKTKGSFTKYSYDVRTGYSKIVEDWKLNPDGSYSNGSTIGVKVGDIVKYELILNKTENAVDSAKKEQLISDFGTYSGNSYNTDSNIARESLKWEVLDVKYGKIRLISKSLTNKGIYLSNYNGYNNAVYLIDKTCDILYSVIGVGKAKNLKIEDIEEKIDKTKFDYTQYINTDVTPNVKYNETKEYTTLQYPKIYPSEIGCKAISTTDNTGNTLELSSQSSPITGNLTASSRLKVTQTYWTKTMESTDFIDEKYLNIFIKDNNNSNYPWYWLSSRSLNCDSDFAIFTVRYVRDGGPIALTMYNSNGGNYGYSFRFRPVISLEYDVELSGNSTDGWTIN